MKNRCKGYDLWIESGPGFDPHKCSGFHFPFLSTPAVALERAEVKKTYLEQEGFKLRLEVSRRYRGG